MEAYLKDIILKNKEFSKDTNHAYSPNNFQAGATAVITYEPADITLIGLTVGSGKSWIGAFTIALSPMEQFLVIEPTP